MMSSLFDLQAVVEMSACSLIQWNKMAFDSFNFNLIRRPLRDRDITEQNGYTFCFRMSLPILTPSQGETASVRRHL